MFTVSILKVKLKVVVKRQLTHAFKLLISLGEDSVPLLFIRLLIK